jgi:hypothetical protein
LCKANFKGQMRIPSVALNCALHFKSGCLRARASIEINDKPFNSVEKKICLFREFFDS